MKPMVFMKIRDRPRKKLHGPVDIVELMILNVLSDALNRIFGSAIIVVVSIRIMASVCLKLLKERAHHISYITLFDPKTKKFAYIRNQILEKRLLSATTATTETCS